MFVLHVCEKVLLYKMYDNVYNCMTFAVTSCHGLQLRHFSNGSFRCVCVCVCVCVSRLLEQAPVQMGVAAVRWSKLVIPMVVHSASKVRLRAAAAMELGLPLLLERQNEVAAVIEPLMPTVSSQPLGL